MTRQKSKFFRLDYPLRSLSIHEDYHELHNLISTFSGGSDTRVAA